MMFYVSHNLYNVQLVLASVLLLELIELMCFRSIS